MQYFISVLIMMLLVLSPLSEALERTRSCFYVEDSPYAILMDQYINNNDAKVIIEENFPGFMFRPNERWNRRKLTQYLKQLKNIAVFARTEFPIKHSIYTKDNLKKMRVNTILIIDIYSTCLVEYLISKIGWSSLLDLSSSEVDAIWYAIQHSREPSLSSPTQIMEKALPWIRKLMEAGKLGPRKYAAMEDRLRLRRGEKQYWGTIYDGDKCVDGRLLPRPTVDPETLAERRAMLGLEPEERRPCS